MLTFLFCQTITILILLFLFMITKVRLLAALNLAKVAHDETVAVQALLDAANVALTEANSKNTSLEVSLAAVTAERDAFKSANDVLTDPEVTALVDELVPVEPVV